MRSFLDNEDTRALWVERADRDFGADLTPLEHLLEDLEHPPSPRRGLTTHGIGADRLSRPNQSAQEAPAASCATPGPAAETPSSSGGPSPSSEVTDG